MSATAASIPTARAPSPVKARSESLSRAGWLFLSVFFIIVFEGAVRKWVTNAASLPLIGLRDLLALLLIVYAWRHNLYKRQYKIAVAAGAWSVLVLGWGLFQLVLGESNPLLLLIGLRFWLLYTWYAVAAASALSEHDYRVTFKFTCWLMIVLAPLVVLQYLSPPGARINAQTDGDEGDVFVVVAGVVRTTATFSFTSGFATFMGLVAPVILGMLGAEKRGLRNMLFPIAVFLAFAAGTLVSGSRTAYITTAVFFAAYLGGRLIFSKMKKKPAAFAAVVMALAFAALLALFFQDAIVNQQTRFEQASAAENIWERLAASFFGEPQVYDKMSWFGAGIGYGSNLANYVRTGSAETFALAETEAGRVLLEGGLLGVTYLVLKVVISVAGLLRSVMLCFKANSPYPMLVWMMTIVAIMTWPASGQLTANGFMGVMLALALLVLRYPKMQVFPPRSAS